MVTPTMQQFLNLIMNGVVEAVGRTLQFGVEQSDEDGVLSITLYASNDKSRPVCTMSVNGETGTVEFVSGIRKIAHTNIPGAISDLVEMWMLMITFYDMDHMLDELHEPFFPEETIPTPSGKPILH